MRSVLLQKIYLVDFFQKRAKDNGIVSQYYVKNKHEPIIPRDLYIQVQEEMVRRANLHSGTKRKKWVYTTAASKPYQVLFTVLNVGIFIAESPGITGRSIHGLTVFHPCGAWNKEMRCADHSGVRFAGCGEGWQKHKIEKMKEFLDKQINESLAYDEQLFVRLVKKIRCTRIG